MKIKLPAGSPSPSEVARTLGATGAEVRSVDRLLDQISGSNSASGRVVAKKSRAAKAKTRRTARKRTHWIYLVGMSPARSAKRANVFLNLPFDAQHEKIYLVLVAGPALGLTPRILVQKILA